MKKSIKDLDDNTLSKAASISLDILYIIDILATMALFFAIRTWTGQLYADMFLFVMYIFASKRLVDAKRQETIDEALKKKRELEDDNKKECIEENKKS